MKFCVILRFSSDKYKYNYLLIMNNLVKFGGIITMESRITTITFNADISAREMSGFRGAIMKMFPDELLYHNHQSGGFRYRYPLIQYKRLGGRPALVGIDNGAESLEKHWTTGERFTININGVSKELTVASKSTCYFSPAIAEDGKPFQYMIRNWIPLNQDNYHRFKETDDLQEQIGMLNVLLVANILSSLKGMGHWVEIEIKANISEIIRTKKTRYKGNELICFDVRINSSISLPDHCGIGKASSKGYGTIIPQAGH